MRGWNVARGQVVLVALNMESVELRPIEWVGREVQLQCAYGALGPDWDLALAMLGDRRVLAAPLISRTVPLEGIQAAFQSLLQPTDELQVLVSP